MQLFLPALELAGKRSMLQKRDSCLTVHALDTVGRASRILHFGAFVSSQAGSSRE
jgi:hypothetical protein